MRLAFAGSLHQLKRKSFVGQIVVVLLGLQIFFLGSFVAIPLPTPTGGNMANYFQNRVQKLLPILPVSWAQELLRQCPNLVSAYRPVRLNLYVPEAPVAIFVGYTLGWQLGIVSSLLYLLLGLVGTYFGIHAFSAGGGPEYLYEPSFGYLVGMLLASFLSGKLTEKRRSSVSQLLAIILGVFCVHLVGIIYLSLSYILSGVVEGSHPQLEWHNFVLEEVRNLSVYTFPYDLIFSSFLVGIGFPFRWLVATLTAPDIAFKINPQPKLEDIE